MQVEVGKERKGEKGRTPSVREAQWRKPIFNQTAQMDREYTQRAG